VSFNQGLSQGDVLSNKRLCEIFKCSPQGGMRRSIKTNTLVIISNYVNSIYDDRWITDSRSNVFFYYTGMGQKGNQNLDYAQNKTLAEANSNGISVHLFNLYKQNEYTYIGEVYLANSPFCELQPDLHNNIRYVWIFPLKLKNETPLIIPKESIQNKYEKKSKTAKQLNVNELKKIVDESRGDKSVIITSTSNTYLRDPYVSELAKKLANGCCRLCNNFAPFSDMDNNPYLESHHVKWLSKGGEDEVKNIVALCPNCHKRMHILNKKEDVKLLKNIAKQQINDIPV